jgi:hypothetical protein
MAVKRSFNEWLIILLLFFCNDFLFCEIRDPFKPTQKIKNKELLLNAILTVNEKRLASISYNDINYIVCEGGIVGQIFKIHQIDENELKLINLETNQEKVILLQS